MEIFKVIEPISAKRLVAISAQTTLLAYTLYRSSQELGESVEGSCRADRSEGKLAEQSAEIKHKAIQYYQDRSKEFSDDDA